MRSLSSSSSSNWPGIKSGAVILKGLSIEGRGELTLESLGV